MRCLRGSLQLILLSLRAPVNMHYYACTGLSCPAAWKSIAGDAGKSNNFMNINTMPAIALHFLAFAFSATVARDISSMMT